MSDVAIRDFTIRDTTLKFKIYDIVFEAAPELPLGALAEISRLRNMRQVAEESGLDTILDIMALFILDDSMERLRAMVNNKKTPFGVRHATELIPWILEEYGLRPTRPSLPSSTGSSDGETGTSSTDGAQPEELIRSDLPQLAHST